MKIRLNSSYIFCLALFLMVVGNGAFIISKFEFKIEYIGLILLLCSELLCLSYSHIHLGKISKFLITSILFAIGPCTLLSDVNLKLSMIITSTIISFLSFYSGNILLKIDNLLLACKSLFFGCLTNMLIGTFTGTLGLKLGFASSPFGIRFLSGFLVKNYCGGIWLIIFIIYYIYCFKKNILCNKANLLIFLINMILIVISGSSGALILLLIFLFCVNFKTILNVQKNQRYLINLILIVIFTVCFVFIYNVILPKITTYAYRIRGLNSIIENCKLDSQRMFYGFSDIAYGNKNYDYTINMRNYLGWDSSVEMAYSNILIKYGVFGIIGYLIIFYNFFRSIKLVSKDNKLILFSILFVVLLSGFVETYFVSIHYVVGPVLYCLINGLIKQKIKNVEGN